MYEPNSRLEIFSTCPPIGNTPLAEYSKAVADAARWSENWGCTGILVYTDNSQVDPWLVSQVIVQETKHLAPLVAVQPIYMHPYTVAKMVSSLGALYGRRIYLNLVAGGFKNDLVALDDPTPHDERYERLVEYATIIKGLLADRDAITFQGKFYRVNNLKITPPLPGELFPGVLIFTHSSYWLAPFENYKTFCPYLVGSYEQVGEELARYLALGCRTFILDVPLCEEDLKHARLAFDLACNKSHIAEADSSRLPAAPVSRGEDFSSPPAHVSSGDAQEAVPIQRMSGG